MSASRNPDPKSKSDKTTPGVKMLKQIWNIPSKQPPKPAPPTDVVSDIYRVPARRNGVPPRSRNQPPG